MEGVIKSKKPLYLSKEIECLIKYCQIVLPSFFFEEVLVGVFINPLKLNGGLPIIKLNFF